MVTKPMVQLSLLVRTARLIVSRWKRILLGAEENSSREKSVGLKWEVCVETGDCDGKFPFKPIPGVNGGDSVCDRLFHEQILKRRGSQR